MTNLRDKFLIKLGQEECTIFLVNGVKLSGRVRVYDDGGVVLYHQGNSQYVERHATATILPQNAFGAEYEKPSVKLEYQQL